MQASIDPLTDVPREMKDAVRAAIRRDSGCGARVVGIVRAIARALGRKAVDSEMAGGGSVCKGEDLALLTSGGLLPFEGRRQAFFLGAAKGVCVFPRDTNDGMIELIEGRLFSKERGTAWLGPDTSEVPAIRDFKAIDPEGG